MGRGGKALACGALPAAILAVALLFLRSPGKPLPPSPPAGSSSHAPAEAGPPDARSPLSTEAGPDGAPRAAPSPRSPPSTESREIADVTRAVLADFHRRLKALGNVTAYLAEKDVGALALKEVSEKTKQDLLADLASADAGRSLRAALALIGVKLDPADLAVLEQRLADTLSGMHDESGKKLSLVLAYALASHGDPSGVRQLSDALQSGHGSEVSGFRSGATLVLALAGETESAPLLRDLLSSDSDRLVRKNAAVGLGVIGGEEDRKALAAALGRETDPEVRAWCALADGRATPKGSGSPEIRAALAHDPAEWVRGAAAYALSRTEQGGAAGTLLETFYDNDQPFVRIGAVAGLARGPDAGAADVDTFLAGEGTTWLDHAVTAEPDPAARLYAAKALALLPASTERSAALMRAAETDTNAGVRLQAVDSLVATEGKGVIDFLAARAKTEKNRIVRRRIADQLARLDGK